MKFFKTIVVLFFNVVGRDPRTARCDWAPMKKALHRSVRGSLVFAVQAFSLQYKSFADVLSDEVIIHE